MTTQDYEITEEWVKDVATGGAVLGGGGGGSLEEGIEFGTLAVEYGTPSIVPMSSLNPSDIVLTVSGVGAPAATESHVDPSDYVLAVELLVDRLAQEGMSVGALMTNEMGGFASVNGLLQSAVTGLPLVDAACNGRAHPTGPMGSIGIESDESVLQSGVGGVPETDRRHEVVIRAQLGTAATTIRRTAEAAGGLVAVARNPVTVEYATEHAAVDVYDQSETVGAAVRTATDGAAGAETVADVLNGEVVVTGTVDSCELETTGGFDVGTVTVDGYELTFWNEYMTLERNGNRLATFPDLVTTLDADSARPVSTAEIEEGYEVSVIMAPGESLSLGAGMRNQTLFEPVETAVDRAVISYAFNQE